MLIPLLVPRGSHGRAPDPYPCRLELAKVLKFQTGGKKPFLAASFSAPKETFFILKTYVAKIKIWGLCRSIIANLRVR